MTQKRGVHYRSRCKSVCHQKAIYVNIYGFRGIVCNSTLLPPPLQTYSYVVFFVVYEGAEEKAHGGEGFQIAVAKAIFQRCSSLES
jgi:hypothetical protein